MSLTVKPWGLEGLKNKHSCFYCKHAEEPQVRATEDRKRKITGWIERCVIEQSSLIKGPFTRHWGYLKTTFFRWKRIITSCFPFTLHRRNVKAQQSSVIMFCFCVWGKLGQGNRILIATSPFSQKLRSQDVYQNTKPALSNSFGLKSAFEKLRFRDGLVWTVGLTVQIKLCFQISPAQVGLGVIWKHCSHDTAKPPAW